MADAILEAPKISTLSLRFRVSGLGKHGSTLLRLGDDDERKKAYGQRADLIVLQDVPRKLSI